MRSIYQQALGHDFDRLHPQIQKRFGFNSQDHIAAIGRGVMDDVWHGRSYTLPFLYLGSWRHIMFPARGQNVPFTLHNYAYRDGYGRETVTWIRTFDFPRKQRRFDATMIYSPRRNCIVDYLGSHQHLAVDIHISVADNGGLCLQSGEQRFYEGPLAFCFPMSLSGVATVCEWYDEATKRFAIEVKVSNKTWGPLFGYRGFFAIEYCDVPPEVIPTAVKPFREEVRE